MMNYSLPPRIQSDYAGAPLQQFAELISRHKYVTVAIVCLLLVTIAAAVMMIQQRPSAQLDNNAQAASLQHEAAAINTPSAEPVQQPSAPVSSESTTASGNSSETEFVSENGKTSLKVNNQQIPVPENGSVHRTVPSGDGNTEVNVSSSSTQNNSGTSSSSTSIQVNTSSETAVDNSE